MAGPRQRFQGKALRLAAENLRRGAQAEAFQLRLTGSGGYGQQGSRVLAVADALLRLGLFCSALHAPPGR